MRSTRQPIFVIALVAAAFAAGCDTPGAEQSPGVSATVVKGAKQELKKAGQQTKEALEATKDYAYTLRDKFVKDMQGDLGKVNDTLQQLSDKVERSNTTSKAEAKAKLEALRDKVAQMNVELDKAKNAQETAWGEVQTGFKKSNEDLKNSVDQARTWLSDKIAP